MPGARRYGQRKGGVSSSNLPLKHMDRYVNAMKTFYFKL